MKNLLKKRSKNIQKAFNSNSLILKMLQDIDSTEQLNYWMSIIFSYYLCSFDKKNNYTLDELMDKNNKLMESAYKTGKSSLKESKRIPFLSIKTSACISLWFSFMC